MTTTVIPSEGPTSNSLLLAKLIVLSVLLHGLVLYLSPDISIPFGEPDSNPTLSIHLVTPGLPEQMTTTTVDLHSQDYQPQEIQLDKINKLFADNTVDVATKNVANTNVTKKPEPQPASQIAPHNTDKVTIALAQNITRTEPDKHALAVSGLNSSVETRHLSHQTMEMEESSDTNGSVSKTHDIPVNNQNNIDQDITSQSSQHKLSSKQNMDAASQTVRQPVEISSASAQDEQRQHLLERIHDAMAKHIEYPLRARRRGWEGEVLLAFNLSRRGHIDNIHVSRSSGYSLLDNSALHAMHKVKEMSWPDFQDSVPMTDLEIPVLYRLTDG